MGAPKIHGVLYWKIRKKIHDLGGPPLKWTPRFRGFSRPCLMFLGSPGTSIIASWVPTATGCGGTCWPWPAPQWPRGGPTSCAMRGYTPGRRCGWDIAIRGIECFNPQVASHQCIWNRHFRAFEYALIIIDPNSASLWIFLASICCTNQLSLVGRCHGILCAAP